MLNPVLSNFIIFFSDEFFPIELAKKYDNFLFHKNSPFKSIQAHLYESIQVVNIPGINLQMLNLQGIGNVGKNLNGEFSHTTINRQYAGTASLNEILEATVLTITFKNSILNWMYCYELLYQYYKRTRTIEDFNIILDMQDAAQIPMIRFRLSDCFISGMPGLEFAYNQSFSETKTFDCSFAFNKFDVEFIIPDFELKSINLKN
jgi:hypothetical protein